MGLRREWRDAAAVVCAATVLIPALQDEQLAARRQGVRESTRDVARIECWVVRRCGNQLRRFHAIDATRSQVLRLRHIDARSANIALQRRQATRVRPEDTGRFTSDLPPLLRLLEYRPNVQFPTPAAEVHRDRDERRLLGVDRLPVAHREHPAELVLCC